MPKQKKNIPALRFPEFSEEWKLGSLGDLISSLDAGVSVNSEDKQASSEQKGILKTSCVSNGVFDPQQNKIVVSKKEVDRLKEPVKKNTIIISRMNTPALVGANAFVNKDYPNLFLPDRLWATKIKGGHCPPWVGIVVSSKRIRQVFSDRGTGTSGSMKNISKGDVLTAPVFFPKKVEQQKIATFLGAVDEKIDSLQKKKDLLGEYKKGCMQKLFSQEMRFTDDSGNAFPNWEEKRLNQLVTKSASTVTAQSLEGRMGEYPVYGASGIAGYIDSYASEKQHIGVIKDGAGVGRVCLCPAKSSVLGTLESLAAKSTNDIVFVYQWLLNMSFEPYKTGTTIPHVYFRDYGKKKAKFPHPEEQKKIADFLSAIDDKITLIVDELDSVRAFKKGLLQQMFV